MIPKPIQLAHELVRQVVTVGDVVVDATLGNGYDALFLAKLVGEQGRVIGFDVQASAIENAAQNLRSAGRENVTFHHCGHEHLAQYAPNGLAAVMFNLGYLPKADKSIITTEKTTIPAVVQAMKKLRSGGLITLMCYPAHDGGAQECQAVENVTSGLERRQWRVFRYAMLNGNDAPFLIVVEKL